MSMYKKPSPQRMIKNWRDMITKWSERVLDEFFIQKKKRGRGVEQALKEIIGPSRDI